MTEHREQPNDLPLRDWEEVKPQWDQIASKLTELGKLLVPGSSSPPADQQYLCGDSAHQVNDITCHPTSVNDGAIYTDVMFANCSTIIKNYMNVLFGPELHLALQPIVHRPYVKSKLDAIEEQIDDMLEIARSNPESALDIIKTQSNELQEVVEPITESILSFQEGSNAKTDPFNAVADELEQENNRQAELERLKQKANQLMSEGFSPSDLEQIARIMRRQAKERGREQG